MKVTLKAARVNANLTQEEAAKLIGVSPSVIVAWENGLYLPTIKRLSAILNAYHVGFDDVIFMPEDNALSVKDGDNQ